MKALRSAAVPYALALLFATLFGAASSLAGVQGTLIMKADGRRVSGELRWKGSQRAYTVTSKQVETSVGIDQVEDVEIPAPPVGLDAAAKQVQEGRFGAAIPVLKQIVSDYRMLKYDAVACTWLANAYTGNKQPKEAIAAIEDLTRDNPELLGDGGIAGAYLDALIADQQDAKTETVLGKIIELGSRDGAATALNKRGEMKMRRNSYKDALIDGYLRTIVLFEDVKQAQPEALYKASKCFDQLGQAPYAEKMRKKLMQEYPQSRQAELAKSGK
jgi:TolA-binding protein